MSKLRLTVVTASTRPGRVGPAIADWAAEVAREHDDFEITTVDLAELALPVFDEPNHPRAQNFENDHTKTWAKIVDDSDAFVFVTPEYNFGPTPALLNALTYLSLEWNYKPAAFVSYAHLSGGLRGVDGIKPTLNALKIVPLNEGVPIPFFTQHLVDGKFDAKDIHRESATAMFNELKRWATALKTIRTADAEVAEKAA